MGRTRRAGLSGPCLMMAGQMKGFTMIEFTKAETATINAAYRSIAYLCSCTNWSDAGQWRDAEKLERKQASAGEKNIGTWARAMIVKGWAEGLDDPDRTARAIYHIRPGYLSAFLLGVRHAVERAGDDYNGPMVAEARELCNAAIAANEAHTRRIVEG
jgi:hypothetical protein